jgi:hypothetical protein
VDVSARDRAAASQDEKDPTEDEDGGDQFYGSARVVVGHEKHRETSLLSTIDEDWYRS